MKNLLCLIFVVTAAFLLPSCEADEGTYNSFLGDWHLERINANGEYRQPRPNVDSCFNLHFFDNNSMIGESVSSTFSSVYNLRKKNKIFWSGFYYVPTDDDTTDNIVFMNDILATDSYEMRGDTLKFLCKKKTYLLFVRR